MKNYIGIKLLQAEPMTDNTFRALKNKPLVAEDSEGYLVQYSDSYESWSPKDVFEAAYLPMVDGSKITPSEINDLCASISTSKVDDKTTLVKATLTTGFVDYATSSCVAPENYDETIGRQIAGKRIEEKVWFAMGFILQWAKYGLKKIAKDASVLPPKPQDPCCNTQGTQGAQIGAAQ